MDVDIMELSKPETLKVKEEVDPYATECSSSFDDDSLSGGDNHNHNNDDVSACPSDAEVDSHFFENDEFGFDELGSLFPMRKKKLTAHWRNFIRPLMWRCKWAELKMKEIQSQSLKYDKELAEFDRVKKIEQDQCRLPGSSSKSSQYVSRMGRRRRMIMKRRKRKRVEDSVDIKPYVSQHNLFSYHENKNTNSDGSVVVEEFSNPVVNDINHEELVDESWMFRMSKDSTDSPEPFLRQIANIQSQVRSLKSRLVSVISENGSMLSSSENFSLHLPNEAQTSSAQSLDFSANMGGLYDMADENSVPYYSIFAPDIIESTVGSLSSVDLHTQIGDTSEAVMDNAAIESALRNQRTEKNREEEGGSEQEESSNNYCKKLGAKSGFKHEEQQMGNVGLGPDICFPKAKGKRGERKPGFRGGWKR
ncbi:uncharacterized protein LOC124912340 [Impatiens glandulifera]|uniref:uncharacterized protein LOC124912340 n=1 Tax=Impatiens glandulifera TaxID=253017 RepID=UPI001FB19765|nr:uncharacterized protein LOC124912340 [Impatiens glandulifera]